MADANSLRLNEAVAIGDLLRRDFGRLLAGQVASGRKAEKLRWRMPRRNGKSAASSMAR